jgi:hypothetical protein
VRRTKKNELDTNLEDCYVARIEYGMYLSGYKHAIADIVDVVEICHILPVFWPIFYDEAKPLKWQMDQVSFQAKKRMSNTPQNPVQRE